MDSWGSLSTKQLYERPLKIDMTAKASSVSCIRLYMGRGSVAVEEGCLWVSDPVTGYFVDYQPETGQYR